MFAPSCSADGKKRILTASADGARSSGKSSEAALLDPLDFRLGAGGCANIPRTKRSTVALRRRRAGSEMKFRTGRARRGPAPPTEVVDQHQPRQPGVGRRRCTQGQRHRAPRATTRPVRTPRPGGAQHVAQVTGRAARPRSPAGRYVRVALSREGPGCERFEKRCPSRLQAAPCQIGGRHAPAGHEHDHRPTTDREATGRPLQDVSAGRRRRFVRWKAAQRAGPLARGKGPGPGCKLAAAGAVIRRRRDRENPHRGRPLQVCRRPAGGADDHTRNAPSLRQFVAEPGKRHRIPPFAGRREGVVPGSLLGTGSRTALTGRSYWAVQRNPESPSSRSRW